MKKGKKLRDRERDNKGEKENNYRKKRKEDDVTGRM